MRASLQTNAISDMDLQTSRMKTNEPNEFADMLFKAKSERTSHESDPGVCERQEPDRDPEDQEIGIDMSLHEVCATSVFVANRSKANKVKYT